MVVAVPDAPTPEDNTRNVVGCYLMRFRLYTLSGIWRTVLLRRPFIPETTFLRVDAIQHELARALALLREQELYDMSTPVELLDLSLVTLARCDDPSITL